ncbi:GntR family transcriptional regulator [Williamsia sp. D3]|uniref:GntR family transcriptional regulator n=1 Tax=Williamsia sp. D3 TaxID=1313067 RepID=UPI001F298D8A|nr:GntR family transcriptional regulator [Williamsia sp. D3]
MTHRRGAGMIELSIDPESDVAPYEQVRRGIIELVNSGRLLAGSRIPTVRALAEELDLAPNTVARSYRELEAEDVIETRGRQGSFCEGARRFLGAAGRAVDRGACCRPETITCRRHTDRGAAQAGIAQLGAI